MSFLGLKKFFKIERRRFPRLKDKTPVLWHLAGSSLKGLGRLRDISASGLAFTTKEPIPPMRSILRIEPQIKGNQAGALLLPLPQSKVVRVKKQGWQGTYEVGAKFTGVDRRDKKELTEAIRARLRAVADWGEIKAKLDYVFLWAVIILGSLLFFYQYRSFVQTRSHLESALAASQRESLRFRTAFLEERARRLTHEDMFTQIVKERNALLVDLNQAKASLTETGGLVSQLSFDKENLTAQVALLEDRMRLLKVELGSLTGTKESLENRLVNLRALRLAIKNVKREALLARVKARRELDQIKLNQGNRGYLIKDSKSTIKAQSVVIKVLPVEAEKK